MIRMLLRTCMPFFWITAGARKNSWSGGSLSASGVSTVKEKSNFSVNKKGWKRSKEDTVILLCKLCLSGSFCKGILKTHTDISM